MKKSGEKNFSLPREGGLMAKIVDQARSSNVKAPTLVSVVTEFTVDFGNNPDWLMNKVVLYCRDIYTPGV